MAKLFSADYRNKSARNIVTGALPTNSGAEFTRGDKGFCNQSKAGYLTYPAIDLSTSNFSVVMWFKANEYSNVYLFSNYTDSNNRWYLRIDGTPSLQFYSKTGGTTYVSGSAKAGGLNMDQFNGKPICWCVNFDRENGVISGYANGIPLTNTTLISTGNLIIDDLNVGGYYPTIYNEDLQIFKLDISTDLLTDAEMQELYQEFLNAPGPISQPTTLNPRVEVDGAEESLSDPLFDDTSSDPWDVKSNVTWLDGESTFDNSGGVNAYADIVDIGLDDLATYELTYEVVSVEGTGSFLLSSVGGLVSGSIPDSVGIHTVTRASDGSADRFRIYRNGSDNGSIVLKNIRLKRVQKCLLCYDFQQYKGNSTILDLSGNGNHGTVNGFIDATEDGAKFNRKPDGTAGATIFGGTGGGITGNLSIEVMVDIGTLISQEGFINKGDTNAVNINYYLGTVAPLSIRFIVGGDGVSSQDYNVPGIKFGKNTHIIATADGSNLKVYVNGSLVGSTPQTATPTNNFENICVGGLTYNYFNYDGIMKFCKVYNYALSQEQVEQKYNKIATALNLRVAENNLLPDQKTLTAGMRFDV